MANGKLNLLVKSVTDETPDIRLFDLRSPDGSQLPKFTAGAHIDLHLSNGLIRSYSIVNGEHDRSRYLIGVARDKKSRGGSAYIHNTLMAGDGIYTSLPKNNFLLDENEHDNILIAGGIGITPIMSMLHRLQFLGRRWDLYFATRSKHLTPFLRDLAKYSNAVKLHIDDEHNGCVLDIGKIVTPAKSGTHFYCCGPGPMLDSFQRAVVEIPQKYIHVEHFSPVERAATAGGFSIELAKSNRIILVTPGKTILEALLEAGVEVPFSCQSGVCGSCETKVLSGLPDHRDLILTDSERNGNKTMMICCSGSKSEKLVLDL
jgi:ferredoxin-NADP reductase